MSVWDLERKILNSQPLRPDELKTLEDTLRSQNRAETVLACEGLLRLGDSRQRSTATATLVGIADEINSGGVDATADFIMALFNLPPPALSAPAFRRLLAVAASHSDESVRVNCMLALGVLASTAWAQDLLRAGLKDSSEQVRQNAQVSLRTAGASERNEG